MRLGMCVSEGAAEDLAVSVVEGGMCCTGVSAGDSRLSLGMGLPQCQEWQQAPAQLLLRGKASAPARSWCQTAARGDCRGQAEPAPGTGASSAPGCAASPGAQPAPPAHPPKHCWLIPWLKKGNLLI